MKTPSKPRMSERKQSANSERFQRAMVEFEISRSVYEEEMTRLTDQERSSTAITKSDELSSSVSNDVIDDPNRQETEADGIRAGELRVLKVRHYMKSSQRHKMDNEKE